MQHKTVSSPTSIQILFLLLLALGAVGFSFSYQYTSASPLDNYCERQFELSFMQKLLPVAKKCESRFKIITDEWYSGLYSNK